MLVCTSLPNLLAPTPTRRIAAAGSLLYFVAGGNSEQFDITTKRKKEEMTALKLEESKMPAVLRGVTDSVVCFHGGHIGKFDISKGEICESQGSIHMAQKAIERQM